MSLKQIKSPREKGSSEQPRIIAQDQFLGAIKDVPLSEIPEGSCYKMVNAYGFGNWAQGRPGTRRYSKATRTLQTFTITGNTLVFPASHGYATGDKIGFYSTGILPSPLDSISGAYDTCYVIKISATVIKLANSYADAIAGTEMNINDAGEGTHYTHYKGDLNSVLDHKENKLVVKHYGTKVYVANRNLESYTEVINTDATNPTDDDSMLVSYEKSAILAAGAVYKIILDDDFYWMFRINIPNPTVLITDSLGSAYVYRYVYSQAIISGSGNRSRVTDAVNNILLFESGVAKEDYTDKNYSEVTFATAIGANLAVNHLISYLTLPLANQAITHLPLYRTKNIGTTTNGAGNNSAYYVWVDDVPVCKAFIITCSGTTVTSSLGTFEIGDVGNLLIGIDISGNIKSGTISAYTSGTTVTVSGDDFVDSETYYSAFGGGRIMIATQNGNIVSISNVSNTFEAADVGRRIFWANGDTSIIKRYISTLSVEVGDSETRSTTTITIQKTSSYAFRRVYNDTIKDDGTATGEVGLVERMLASVKTVIYTPLVNFRPVGSSNIVAIESGIAMFGNRDDSKYSYSAIGARSYSIGMHMLDIQTGKIHVGIRCIKPIPGKFVLFAVTKTFVINASMPIEVGNTKIGESITKLVEPTEIDGNIGVTAWQTICPINSMLYIAITSEPAVRMFDGNSWSKENMAIINGFSAVGKDLLKMDNYYKIIAWYSHIGGYKISATKWVETNPGTEPS